MWRSFRVGRTFGIPLELDLSFLLMLPLLAWAVGLQVEAVAALLNGFWGAGIGIEGLARSPTRWVLGLAGALGLFVGVLLHELGHSLVARRYGHQIESITLWVLGGIARMSDLPEDWREELAIAVAGPAVSVIVGIGSFALFVLTAGLRGTFAPPTVDGLAFLFGYLAVLNVALAAFNVLPAFPMDGGRILRAVLARNRSYVDATSTAARVGKWFAVLFAVFGLVRADVVLIGVAFFVYVAATSEAQQVAVRAAFRGVPVREVMTPAARLRTVTPDTTVGELPRRMFHERHSGYPVVRAGRPVGMVTLEDARGVREVERDAYRVDDVMSEELVTVGPDEEAVEAFERLQEHDVGRLLVLDDGELVGLVSRTDLVHAFDVAESTGADLPRGRGPGPS
ncbi:metalloprotease [Halobacteriales archaeon QS_1_68_20]|nr:MAG: metalloprotease [Halobacteriales archaeon QS_1_68_20]